MPGHRVLAVAVLAFALWLPLCLLAIWAAQAFTPHPAAPDGAPTTATAAVIVGLLVTSFFAASGLASGIVRSAVLRSTPTDAVAGGALAAVVACSVAAAAGDLVSVRVAAVSVLILGGAGALGGGIGGWLGRRWADRGPRRVDPPHPPH